MKKLPSFQTKTFETSKATFRSSDGFLGQGASQSELLKKGSTLNKDGAPNERQQHALGKPKKRKTSQKGRRFWNFFLASVAFGSPFSDEIPPKSLPFALQTAAQLKDFEVRNFKNFKIKTRNLRLSNPSKLEATENQSLLSRSFGEKIILISGVFLGVFFWGDGFLLYGPYPLLLQTQKNAPSANARSRLSRLHQRLQAS